MSSRGIGLGLGLDVDGSGHPGEDALLADLEELAQKTEVLTHWADEMYDYVKAVPQSALFLRRSGLSMLIITFRAVARSQQVHTERWRA